MYKLIKTNKSLSQNTKMVTNSNYNLRILHLVLKTRMKMQKTKMLRTIPRTKSKTIARMTPKVAKMCVQSGEDADDDRSCDSQEQELWGHGHDWRFT